MPRGNPEFESSNLEVHWFSQMKNRSPKSVPQSKGENLNVKFKFLQGLILPLRLYQFSQLVFCYRLLNIAFHFRNRFGFVDVFEMS